MTDITKFKSIAIKLETYNKAKLMTDKNYMSMSAFVRYLVDKEFKNKIISNRFLNS